MHTANHVSREGKAIGGVRISVCPFVWMPFGVMSGVGLGMGVLDFGGDRRRERGSLGVNLRRPIVTNGDFGAIGLSRVLRPTKHIIGHIGDGFYGSNDPTNSVKALKEDRS